MDPLWKLLVNWVQVLRNSYVFPGAVECGVGAGESGPRRAPVLTFGESSPAPSLFPLQYWSCAVSEQGGLSNRLLRRTLKIPDRSAHSLQVRSYAVSVLEKADEEELLNDLDSRYPGLNFKDSV